MAIHHGVQYLCAYPSDMSGFTRQLHTGHVCCPAACKANLWKPTDGQPTFRYTGLNSCRRVVIAAGKATSPVSANNTKQGTRRGGYKGISKVSDRGLFRAVINIAGKRHHIGYFPDEMLAAKAYDLATLKLKSEGMLDKAPVLNFPDAPYTEEEIAETRIPSLQPKARDRKLKGVSAHTATGKWQATIFYNGSDHHLGYYESDQEAAKAYDNEVRGLEQQGMLRRSRKLNFPNHDTPVIATVQDSQAQQQHSSSSSKKFGVCWDNQTSRWRAQMWYNDKTHNLGQYDTEEDAAKAYDTAVLRLIAEGRLAAGVRPLNYPKESYSKETIQSAKVPSVISRKVTSEYYGVSWHRPSQKWRAQIWISGTLTYLGLHDTEEEAARAYNHAVHQALAEGKIKNGRRLNVLNSEGAASKPMDKLST